MREVLQVSGEFFIRRELPLEPLGGCGRIAGIALLLYTKRQKSYAKALLRKPVANLERSGTCERSSVRQNQVLSASPARGTRMDIGPYGS